MVLVICVISNSGSSDRTEIQVSLFIRNLWYVHVNSFHFSCTISNRDQEAAEVEVEYHNSESC